MRATKAFHGILLAIALALTACAASAQTVINFQEIPNGNPEGPTDADILISGFAFDGTPFSLLKPSSEVFHLSSPFVPAGYPADATLSHIGISQSGSDMLVNIMEPDGVTLSDQVYVHLINNIYTVIDFISDGGPDGFVTGVNPVNTIIEDGLLQNALVYTNDRGESVTINIQSDIDVPEPASLSLLGVAGLTLLRRRRQA